MKVKNLALIVGLSLGLTAGFNPSKAVAQQTSQGQTLTDKVECSIVNNGNIFRNHGRAFQFLGVLKKSSPKRIFSLEPRFSKRYSFVDECGVVHTFQHFADYPEDMVIFNNENKRINDFIKEENLQEVDGAISVSQESGTVLHFFRTASISSPLLHPSQVDNFNKQKYIERKIKEIEPRAQKSYETWLEVVKELPSKETLIHYYIDSNSFTQTEYIIMDAVREKDHFMILLDGRGSRTLGNTIESLHGYRMVNVKPIVDWWSDVGNFRGLWYVTWGGFPPIKY